MNLCLNCNQETKNPKFCCRSCSGAYNSTGRIRTEESKRKLSNIMKGRKCPNRNSIPKPKYTKVKYLICQNCKLSKWVAVRGASKYCSPECGIQSRIKNGFKRNHSRIYNGIKLDSSWEESVATWFDKQNIKWIRPKFIWYVDERGCRTRYFPDFYLPELNVFIDTKNDYLISISSHKIAQISSQVKLIVGNVDYVIGEVERIQTSMYSVTVSTVSKTERILPQEI